MAVCYRTIKSETMVMRFLITGANGFVGRALSFEANARGFSVIGATRFACDLPKGVQNIAVGDIDANTDWTDALKNCEVVVHLAARVHVMRELADEPLTEFRKVNVLGTERLLHDAAASGVKRLVYVSSIKVNGEETQSEFGFSELDVPNPQDPYGVSKLEAEQALHRVAIEAGIEVVIVRLPLVYGRGVKGNFAELLGVVKKGIPLPLAAVKNKRDFIYVGNLVDALITCATHPKAPGKTYLVSDGDAVSTPNLLKRLASAMEVTSRLFYVPVWMLKLAGKFTGKSNQIERLVSSLQVDSSKIRHELDWVPPYSLDQGLIETVSDK
jgi:nucleoside-diphosphate-sugar epimerase